MSVELTGVSPPAGVMVTGAGTLEVGPFVQWEPGVLVDLGDSGRGRIVIGARTKLKQGCVLRAYNGEIRLGARTTIGEYTVLAGHGGLEVGDAVIISGHCYLSAAEHLRSGSAPVRFQGESAQGVTVGSTAWLGAQVTVQDGVTIGRGAIIGSGAVVTRSMPPHTVCVGVPCRVVASALNEDRTRRSAVDGRCQDG